MQTDLDIIIENSITDSTETSTLHQAFTNCVHGYDHVHGYDRVHNVHASGVTRTRKFVHSIDSSV